MTHERPEHRWTSWTGKLIGSLFLLVVGGLANQFWNIPVQQMHQDDRLNSLEKHMEYNDKRLDQFGNQHDIMVKQLNNLEQQMIELRTLHEPKRRH